MGQPLPNPTTLLFSKPCTFLFILIICILGFYTLHYPHASPPLSNPQTALRFRRNFLSSATNSTVAAYLRALTQHPHLAGTKPSLDTIHYVQSHFSGLGLQTHTAHYDALLSYPLRSSLSAHFSNGSHVDIPLSEPGLSDDGVVQPYHAYSPSGSAHAKVVFVNYGGGEDYRALEALGVNVSGCVVIARRGGELPRSEAVRNAEKHGAVAVLLYTEGDRRFNKGFERGVVMNGVGDPLSPGWGGVDGAERLDLDDPEVLKRFPNIPSLPLSAEAAGTILGSLGGAPAPPEWRAGVETVGPGPTVVNFTYEVSQMLWHCVLRDLELECSFDFGVLVVFCFLVVQR